MLGSGLCKIYPPEHEPLAQNIIESGGCVMSEYPPFHSSAKWTFPQRNRIVSGLSLGVLVIEAPLKSGAMISARLAGEQGRDIFAVPGTIESVNSSGCHQLIRDGAYLVESADDILSVLGPMRLPVRLPKREHPLFHPNEVSLNDVEIRVLLHLDRTEQSLDSIAAAAKLETHQVSAVLEVLERKRMIRQVAPLLFVRIQ